MTIRLPAFTAEQNLEAALTAAVEECDEALHSYQDADIDQPFIRACIMAAIRDLEEARQFWRAAKC